MSSSTLEYLEERAYECHGVRNKFARNEVAKRAASDADYAIHSHSLRKIFAESDIDLPYCLNLTYIEHFFEDEIQIAELVIAEAVQANNEKACFTDPSNGQIMLNLFQQTLPPFYFDLVQDKFRMIRKGIVEYFTAFAQLRRHGGNETMMPSASNSNSRQGNKKKVEEVANKSTAAADTKTDQKKQKKNKKKKKTTEQVAFLNNSQTYLSNRAQLLMRYGFEYNECADLKLMQNSIGVCLSDGKEMMNSGSLHKGAEYLALGVLFSEDSDQVLSSLEQTLPPAHFALVCKKKRRFEQDCNAVRNGVSSMMSDPAEENAMPDEEDSNNQKKKRKKIDKPDSISEDCWQSFYDLGRHVSDFILDGFEAYESGDYVSWDKNRVKNIESSLRKKNEVKERYNRNLVCEYVLVERMKEKDFFCCDLCQIVLFNYKHALIHFTSSDHCKKETRLIRNSGVGCIRRVLDMFTDLPKKLLEIDEEMIQTCKKQNGVGDADLISNIVNLSETRFHPTHYFKLQWAGTCIHLISNHSVVSTDRVTGEKRFNFLMTVKSVMESVKGDEGRKAMAGLHEHLGQAPTICTSCCIKTGDRDGFFAHYLSYSHLMNVYKREKFGTDRSLNLFVDIIWTFVNVFKKDLVV